MNRAESDLGHTRDVSVARGIAMHPAIEAVCRGGQIVPLEPVQFREDERVVIVRLPASHEAAGVGVAAPAEWRSFVGALRDSPHWQGDPVAIQEGLRSEWD